MRDLTIFSSTEGPVKTDSRKGKGQSKRLNRKGKGQSLQVASDFEITMLGVFSSREIVEGKYR